MDELYYQSFVMRIAGIYAECFFIGLFDDKIFIHLVHFEVYINPF